MVSVRAFREDDAPAVHRMMTELAKQREESTHKVVLRKSYNRFFSAYMMGLLDNPDAVVRVAEDEGDVVGYAVATRGRDQPFLKYNNVAVLNDMFVDEDHRGTGVGKKLLGALRSWAREQDLDALEVQVFPEHKEELEMLEKLGFFQYRVKMLRPLD